MLKTCFVKTTDEETKNKLISEGFNMVSSANGEFVFINDGKLSFDNKNIIYTNVLSI